MPKENKNTNRRSRRQSTELDNHSATSSRESVKAIIGSNRYSPFPRETSRKDSQTNKGNMITPSPDILNSISGGFIENGIKYIMFPLHLLRFCIFGTSPVAPNDSKQCEKVTCEEPRDKTGEKEGKEKDEKEGKEEEVKKEHKEDKSKKEDSRAVPSKERQSSTRTTDVSENSTRIQKISNDKCKNDDSEESNDEMATAAEDSDSSSEQWSSANSTMVMNMSVDPDNFDRSMSYTLLEEPMDISIDEHAADKADTVKKVSRDSKPSENVQRNSSERVFPRSCVADQDTNYSVDEEIARIFQKQCTSSEDELPSSLSTSISSCKYGKPKQSNFLCNKANENSSSSTVRSIKNAADNERERSKKTTTEFVGNNKRRKVTHEEDKSERHSERKRDKRTYEEKRSTRQDTPSKYKSRSSRNPSRVSVRNKESRGKDIKYRETATQTDSAFSDDDVEMVPIDRKLPERRFCCKHAARISKINHYLHGKDMDQELNYIADNEDSNDGFLRISHKRMSSCSTSSSSTDLGFDERVTATPDTDIAIGRWHRNSPDSLNSLRLYSRAPPGFPDVPQNPPLRSLGCKNSKHYVLSCSKDNKMAATVPPAPSPMRHLYYDYPEFMDLPSNVNSSKILNNILRNNYHR